MVALFCQEDYYADVSTVAEIRDAIAQLSLEERAELMAGLCAWEDDEWDRQMKADAQAGKLHILNEATAADYEAGRCAPLKAKL